MLLIHLYIPDTKSGSTLSLGCRWQNQAVVSPLAGSCQTEKQRFANHVILLADQSACQDVSFTCRHCDRFAKHGLLPGNRVTTRRGCVKAARRLLADSTSVGFCDKSQVWFLGYQRAVCADRQTFPLYSM